MLYTLFASICFFIAINKVQSQDNDDQFPLNLSLILINSTSSECEINGTQNAAQSINLCLNEEYSYRCISYNNSNNGGNNNNNNNISLICTLTSRDSECHSSFITNENNANITLDCLYTTFNTTIIGGGNGIPDITTNQFSLDKNDECMYGIYYNNFNDSNNELLLCMVWTPPIVVTTFNNTKIFEETTKYYTFPLFGFKVNKRFVKSYGIIALVVIIVVSCLLGICFCGLCNLCMSSSKSNKHRRNRSNSNSNNYDNRRMPQSANTCNV